MICARCGANLSGKTIFWFTGFAFCQNEIECCRRKREAGTDPGPSPAPTPEAA